MLSEPEIEARFWSHVKRSRGCWEWTLSTNHGYGQIWINGKRWIASRLAWVLTHGEIEDRRLFVCHRCDNTKCVRPDHLFLGRQSQNLSDMRAKGRGALPPAPARGFGNQKTTFTDADVRSIRAEHAAGASLRVLARKHGVWHTTIAAIVHRRTWSHV